MCVAQSVRGCLTNRENNETAAIQKKTEWQIEKMSKLTSRKSPKTGFERVSQDKVAYNTSCLTDDNGNRRLALACCLPISWKQHYSVLCMSMEMSF